MNKFGVDLIGEFQFFKNSGKKNSIVKDYWGHSNIKGEKREDSYYIYLKGKEIINPGESCQAELKFKFSSDEKFKIKLSEGQILELNEGAIKIGEFIIEEIINRNLE